eukprot:3755478-Pyramimonas_sp.AAC.1
MLCEAKKNRFVNRSGITPVQRVLCQLPRLPGSLLSDDCMDPRLLARDPNTEVQRSHKLRLAARRAMMEMDAHQSIIRALGTGARPRVQVQAGD